MGKGTRWDNRDGKKRSYGGRRLKDMAEYGWAKRSGPVHVRKIGDPAPELEIPRANPDENRPVSGNTAAR